MHGRDERGAMESGGAGPSLHEPIFDHIAGLAAKACETPMAAIVLPDDDGWCVRAAVGLALGQAPRGGGIADRVLREGAVVALDASTDVYLRGDALFAAEPAARFYAAAPMALADGERIGALVVLDVAARVAFDARQADLLQGLAAAAADGVRLARLRTAHGRALESRIADSEALYRLIAENSSDAIATFDTQGVFTWLSPAVAEVLGYAPDDLIGRTPMVFVHPDDLPGVLAVFRSRMAAGPNAPTVRFEYRARRKDGTQVWLEAHPRALFDASGNLIGFQDTVRDVTARKQAELGRATSEQRYARIVEYATDVILRSSLDGDLIDISPSAVAVLGFTPAELVANQPNYLDRVHKDDMPRLRGRIDQVMASRSQADMRAAYRFQHKDGRWVWLESNPTLVRDSEGAPLEYLSLVRDISAQHALETGLRDARDAAEAAAQVKADFIANMSHEIRTPLTSIIGFTKMLGARQNLDPEARRYVERLGAAGDALLAVVNDVLDFSKLEAGKVEIAPRATALADLLGNALHMMAAVAEAKGLTLKAALDGLPALVMIDPDRLLQVMLNLLGNAVKFTSSGGVSLAAHHEDGRLQVSVTDTGPGVDISAQARLFQSFSQVDGSATRRHGGTGLGLAISKGLVEAMGGRIGVVSALGEGATFTIDVPAPIPPP